MPTIVALVKHVPDTWSTKTLGEDHRINRDVDNVIDEVNEFSVEQALRLRENNPDAGFRVVALTMGPAQADEALRKALAMGADAAVHVVDDQLAGADALSTAWTLNAALTKLAETDPVQIVVAGSQASDSQTGLLAGLLAEYRQLPALTGVKTLNFTGDKLTGTREDARGTWEIETALPALVTVTDKADKPRFPNFKGLMAAKKAEVTEWSVADLGIDAIAPATQVTDSQELPPRTAGEVISGVSAEEAASQIADFLAARNFI